MNPAIKALIKHFQLEKLPVEGTLYKSTYRSKQQYKNGPIGSAIIGMYCNSPLSISCFHRLQHDEVWHFYGGDPFVLYLLYPDGQTKKVIMGSDILKGQRVQFVIPAQVWQAGELRKGGKYALFGCTMAPGFMGDCFEAGIADYLIKEYPEQASVIRRLSINGMETKMPEGFEG